MAVQRSFSDWALFCALTVLWASAYPLTRGAVTSLPPELIVPARLTLGAMVLLGVLLASGQRLPDLRHRRRWGFMLAMGFFGMIAPFFLIAHAQRTVDSSLAALYVAVAPIFIAVGAHSLFMDERLTVRSGLGVLLGFCGVLVLLGPDAVTAFGSASLIAQCLLVLATGCYATATLIARAAPETPPLSFATGFVTIAAVMSWPILLAVDWAEVEPTAISLISLVGLGLGPSALASLFYVTLVRRAGANFLGLTGYTVPILSAVLGWAFFSETMAWNAVVAFGLILGGVWLAQRNPSAR